MASKYNGPVRLFTRVLLLLLPLLAVVVAWSVMLFMADKSSYDGGIRLSPDVRMVVLGDSHSRHSLNPSLIPGLANFGCVGMSVAERMRLIPYESLVGLALTLFSFLFQHLF